jgi:hypothetical protein
VPEKVLEPGTPQIQLPFHNKVWPVLQGIKPIVPVVVIVPPVIGEAVPTEVTVPLPLAE